MKADLKNATVIDAFQFAKNLTDLTSLKSNTDKLDTGKFEITPVHLSKLSDVVKNNVVKETEYDDLVNKVNTIKTINTGNLVKKTDCNAKNCETN